MFWPEVLAALVVFLVGWAWYPCCVTGGCILCSDATPATVTVTFAADAGPPLGENSFVCVLYNPDGMWPCRWRYFDDSGPDELEINCYVFESHIGEASYQVHVRIGLGIGVWQETGVEDPDGAIPCSIETDINWFGFGSYDPVHWDGT